MRVHTVFFYVKMDICKLPTENLGSTRIFRLIRILRKRSMIAWRDLWIGCLMI